MGLVAKKPPDTTAKIGATTVRLCIYVRYGAISYPCSFHSGNHTPSTS